MSDARALVLLVGHCGPDAYALRSAVRSAAPGAQVEFACDEATLALRLPAADLLLVNRILDGFHPDSGVDLIARLLATPGAPAAMLVSNFPDAQAGALAVGALPGFGKTAMNTPEAAGRIRSALGIQPV